MFNFFLQSITELPALRVRCACTYSLAAQVFWFEMYMLGENFIDLFISDLVHTILSADYLFLWFSRRLAALCWFPLSRYGVLKVLVEVCQGIVLTLELV